MAIIQGIATSFLGELFSGTHVFGTDTFKLALFQSSATLSATTTVYSATGEASGAGYSAGGASLTGAAIATSGASGYIDFADLAFAAVSITFRGGLIYNSSKANKAVCVIDGGVDRTATAQTVTAVFPAAAATTALISITG